jgi:RHS repeat-associated protein
MDETGAAISRSEYLPYGEAWVQTGDKGYAPKYNGQELDGESGFYYYNARHYDPQIGRFISADTVVDGATTSAGWNRYMYVHGNPVMYKDPSGHDSINVENPLSSYNYKAPYTVEEKDGMLVKVENENKQNFGKGYEREDIKTNLPGLIINNGTEKTPKLQLLKMKESNFGEPDYKNPDRLLKSELYDLEPVEKNGKVIGVKTGNLVPRESKNPEDIIFKDKNNPNRFNGVEPRKGLNVINPSVIESIKADPLNDPKPNDSEERIKQEKIMQGLRQGGGF